MANKNKLLMMATSMIAFYRFSLITTIFFSLLINTSLSAHSQEFDSSFYISKICTSYIIKDDNQYCDDGYLLKSETSKAGQVKEIKLLDGIGHYGWNHISINKIDKDTFHVYVGCGNPCGANILFGRGNKEQSFGRYFNYDLNSRCSVSYDENKTLWVSSRFFSDKVTVLPSTSGNNKSAAYPNYNVEFNDKGHMVIKEYFSEEVIQTLPKPC